MIRSILILTLLTAHPGRTEENLGSIVLAPVATVGTQGILLSDLAQSTNSILPKVVLAPAPPVGRPIFLSRAQINELLGKAAPDLKCSNWAGVERVRVVRAARMVDELAIRDLLTAALQAEHVKDRGELELRLSRPWNGVAVPDDPLSVKILEIPTLGVAPHFICRFELLVGGEPIGTLQQPLQAKIWRDIYVARAGLTRGQLLRDADIGLERRDVLALRDYLIEAPIDDPYIELRENLQAGAPLSQRSLRLRAIVKRGRIIDALLQDEGLTISVKAEALEDGVPGQLVRVRNIRSKRVFKGKVEDEQTVSVVL